MDPKKLDKLFERIEQQKKNGCKVLECKTIDENIKLRLENIKLKKMCKKLAEMLISTSYYYDDFKQDELIDLTRKEVENEKE